MHAYLKNKSQKVAE